MIRFSLGTFVMVMDLALFIDKVIVFLMPLQKWNINEQGVFSRTLYICLLPI